MLMHDTHQISAFDLTFCASRQTLSGASYEPELSLFAFVCRERRVAETIDLLTIFRALAARARAATVRFLRFIGIVSCCSRPRRDGNASRTGIAHVGFDHEDNLRSREFI